MRMSARTEAVIVCTERGEEGEEEWAGLKHGREE